jgi:hypothetical protein
MKLETEEKILSGMILLIALATIGWIVVSQIEFQKMLDSMTQTNWAIDIKPDPQQRDIRLALALLLGGISAWSLKGTQLALVLFAIIYVLAEFLSWVVASRYNPFDRTAGEIHIAAGITVVLVLLLWFRKADHIMISTVATFYLIFEYVVWHLETLRLKSSAGVQELTPPTLVNNNLYGAHWWHIVILLTGIIMLAWQAKMLLKRRANNFTAVQAV